MSRLVWSLLFDGPHSHDDHVANAVARKATDHAATTPAALSEHDATLVRALNAGDAAAFEQLFHAEYQGLVTYVTRRTGARWDAEELVQGVFVRLWERHATFAPRTSVRAYLVGAVRLAAIEYFRAVHRPMPERGTLAPAPVPADATLELDDLERAALAAIAQLPPRAREVWTLHRDHGLTVSEVAQQLGVSSNTVKTQLARSLLAIRRAIAPFLGLILLLAR
jgi:RNA polymerase sigma-70 factor (ECF subfamily)